MRAFYEANLALAQQDPPYHFHDPVSPVYTRPRFLPGSRIYNVDIDCVQLADGCRVEGAKLRNAIIGIRSIIADGVQIEDSILMGADYYEEEARHAPKDGPPIGIGPGTTIRGAIVDKNARIGSDVRIEPFPPGTELFEEDWSVRDGIVVIPKNVVIPTGTKIKP
jgi:glucose-1-phosphate adenylyltransferase